MSVSDFALFGRLHPLVLHLPIGLLLGALVLEGLVAKGKVTRPALGLFLWLAALSAVFTATSGWVLSHEEGYGGETLTWHERLGIAVAVAATLAALLHDPRERSRARLGLYRAALGVACVLLLPAGHQGSVLTHGADWLEGPKATEPEGERGVEGPRVLAQSVISESKLAPESAASLAEASEAADTYASVIAPFFAARCTSCHGATKRKDHLRLDSPAGLRAGSESGAVLVPGDAAASLLYLRATLPLEHEDHMPPEGKPQPTPAELAALAAWIAAGAPFGDAAAAPPAEEVPAPAEEEPAPVKPAGPPADALGALDRAFVHHERADPAAEGLWLDVAAVAPTFGDAEVRALLVPLAPWTVELSLARSAITDAVMPELARFPELRRLDLRATGITAAGLAALAGHAKLAELNLVQTKLGDAAVEVLLGLPQLRKVALWNAGLSPEALARLRTAPGLEVNAGDEPEAVVLDQERELAFTSERALPGAELVPEGLRPVNATCPVSGSPVNPKYALVHTSAAGTRVIGFCCPNCPKEFWADPAKFEAKIP